MTSKMNIKQFKQILAQFISKFESDTDKHAIWGGLITNGFYNWLKKNFPKIYDKYDVDITNLRLPINFEGVYSEYYSIEPNSSVPDIADDIGCGYQKLYNHFDKDGIARRNRSECQIARYKKERYKKLIEKTNDD